MSQQLRVSSVSKTFQIERQSILALDTLDLELPPGGFGAIIGPSGCGKSTLLRLIADIMEPTSGSITIGEFPPRRARLDHLIGFVFQSATLLPWRTVRENVKLPLTIVGSKVAGRTARSADDLIDLVGLRGFEDALPSQLSGGMQQRAAIARALVLDPAMLLLDEPFGALDEITRQRMNLELLRIWKESGTTALLVTHSIAEAVFMADRVFVMSPRPGRIEEVLEIALPRPRTIEMMKEPVFYDAMNRIRDTLFRLEHEDEGVHR